MIFSRWYLTANLAISVVLFCCTFAPAETLVFQPGPELGKDAYVYSNAPETNYGEVSYLKVGTIFGEGDYQFSYIEFVELNDYIGNIVIEEAYLKLHGNSNKTLIATIYSVKDKWQEDTITWSNKPEYYHTPRIIIEIPKEQQWVVTDVTEIVELWVDEERPNCGFALISYGAPYNGQACFASSDLGGFEPKLEITFEYTIKNNSSIGQIKALMK